MSVSGQPTIVIPVVYGIGSGGCRLAAALVYCRGPGGRVITQRLSGVEDVCISSSWMDIEQMRAYQQRILYLIGDGTGSGIQTSTPSSRQKRKEDSRTPTYPS